MAMNLDDAHFTRDTRGSHAQTSIHSYFSTGSLVLPGSERKRELKRRRHRRQKLAQLKKRMETANASEKTEIVRKIRELTPGADRIVEQWGLQEIDR